MSRGTADAVRQNLNLIHDFDADLVAVFGADHVYQMDVGQMKTEMMIYRKGRRGR